RSNPPALPPGWTASNAIDPDGILWVTSNDGEPFPSFDSSPNAAFVNDPDSISDKRLDSPSIPIHSDTAQLSFRHNLDLESGFDGGVLEISIGGGAFRDILDAGGSFVLNGYTHTISSFFQSPIAGRRAWSDYSGGFVTTTVNLPADAAGQNIVLRWRMGSDNSVSYAGWRLDTVRITECPAAPTPTPTATATATPTASPTCTRSSFRVLIVFSDLGTQPVMLHDQIAAESGVVAVDYFNAENSTPTLAQVTPYNIVVAFSDTAYSDATAM